MSDVAGSIFFSVLVICITVLICRGCDANHQETMQCMAKGNFSYVNNRCLPEAPK